MPNTLSDTFIQAVPDLTLLVRSDGNILARLGGRELNGRRGAKGSTALTLDQMWSTEVAHRLRQLVRHALKERASLDRKYREADRSYEVRVRPQGIDRVLMVFRELAEDDTSDIASDAVDANSLTTRTQLMRALSAAVTDAALRERRLAVITVYLGGLSDIERVFDAVSVEHLLNEAAQRLQALVSRELPAKGNGSGEAVCLAPIADHVIAMVIESAPSREALRTIVLGMRDTLTEPFALLGRSLRICPAFGIAVAPDDSGDARELLNRARSAMHDAQCAGRAIAFHSDTLRLRALSRLDGERELRWALEHEQFELRYRPLYALADDRLFAIQAQPCWAHPVRGQVAAGEFLALAETSNISREIGRWMLSRTFADLRGVANAVPRAIVTLCLRHVLSGSLLMDITQSVVAAGADPRRLALRIGERALQGAGELMLPLRELRAAGVQVILERFGAGHIAIERLAELPVDVVSLDPLLFRDLQLDQRMRRVCRSVIDVAHALDWQVAAEEISSHEQRALLRELGCDIAGGEIFGAPQDPRELLEQELAVNI
jgi:EAL domain-containing protein (putative c-di-GMP-specific phosphodiesterase class I)/GGDEF domain-containing protein